MSDRINHILNPMAALESELRTAVHDQECGMFFQVKGKRVEFERSAREAHRKLKTSFFRWLVTDRPQNLITGPLIDGMVIPLLLLDACVSFCQWACFRSTATPRFGVAITSCSTATTSTTSTSSRSSTALIASPATG